MPRQLILFLLNLLVLSSCAERLRPALSSPRNAITRRWQKLLMTVSTSRGIDYATLREEREILDRFVYWMGEHGPESDRMSYAREDRKIAYMMNAYNAAVLYAVLEQGPLESVREFKTGVFRSPPGTGFFLGQLFYIDGEWVSLYFLEHQYLLTQYEEPLIHAGLNCASTSCPPVRFFESRELDTQLEAAMREYLASDQGMREIENGQYTINELFFWYEDHFVDWGRASNLCEYLARFVPEEATLWMEDEAETGCELESFSYDWSLNDRSVEP